METHCILFSIHTPFEIRIVIVVVVVFYSFHFQLWKWQRKNEIVEHSWYRQIQTFHICYKLHCIRQLNNVGIPYEYERKHDTYMVLSRDKMTLNANCKRIKIVSTSHISLLLYCCFFFVSSLCFVFLLPFHLVEILCFHKSTSFHLVALPLRFLHISNQFDLKCPFSSFFLHQLRPSPLNTLRFCLLHRLD